MTPEDEKFERIAQRHIADLKKSSKAIVEDAAVRAVHKVMADLDAPLTLNGVALYPKREWVGLTDEELAEFSEAKLGAYDLCLEVEAKLREKNNG